MQSLWDLSFLTRDWTWAIAVKVVWSPKHWTARKFARTCIFFLIIYFCLHWVFVAFLRLSVVAASRGCSSSQHAGFSRRLLCRQSTRCRCLSLRACSARLASCARLRCSAPFETPWCRGEALCLALASELSPTVPSGKLWEHSFLKSVGGWLEFVSSNPMRDVQCEIYLTRLVSVDWFAVPNRNGTSPEKKTGNMKLRGQKLHNG